MLNKFNFQKKITVGIVLLWQSIFLQNVTAQSSTGQWFVQSTNGISPENRHEGSFVEVNGKFYLIGGRGTKKIQVYNPETKTWTNTNTNTNDVHHFQPVAYKSKIYIIGAFNGGYPNENPIANVLIYDTQTDQLATGPAIPSNRLRGSAGVVLYEGKFYIVSGNRKGHRAFTDSGEPAHVTWLDSFDPETNAWQVLPNAPKARDHFHAAVVGTKLYVTGGRRSSFDTPTGTFADTEASVDVFDFRTGAWLTGSAQPANIPTQRAGASVAVYGSELMVIGGETSNNNAVSLPKTEILDTYTKTWRTLANLNTGRHATQAILYKGDVFLAAGSKTQGGTEITAGENFLEAFSFDGAPGTNAYNIWTNISNANKPRSESPCVVYEDEVYFFNGFGPNIQIENSCEKYNPYTNRWTYLKTMPNQSNGLPWAMTHNGIALVSDTVWLVGGRVGNVGNVTSKVWWYVISKDTWYDGPNLPFPVGGGGLGRLGRQLHYVGGFDANAQCDANYHLVYDLDKPSLGWQNITSTAAMPNARNHFATVVLDGKLYTIAGQHGHDAGCVGNPGDDVNDVHVYNPATNQWTQLADFPHNESHMEPSSFAMDGKIYVVGGQSIGSKIHTYDPAANAWTELNSYQLPLNLLAPGARVFDQTFVIMAGGAPNTTFPTSVTRARTFPHTNVNQLSFNPKTLQVNLSGTQTQKISVILSATNGKAFYTLNSGSLPSWLSVNKTQGEVQASSEEIELTFNGAQVGNGTYNFSLIASALGYTNGTLTITLIKNGGGSSLNLAVNQLDLINATNAQTIRTLNTGSDVLMLNQLPASLSINALVGNDAKSVEFQVNGGTPRTENVAPYSLAGDQTSSYTPYPFAPGNYTIKVTAYSGMNKTGTAGTPYTLNLTVQNSTPPPTQTVITSLVLINAANAQSIRTLNPGSDVIVLDQLPAGLSLEAKVGTQVASVEFQVDQNPSRAENIAPYSLAGDQTTSFTPYPFAPGTYVIKVTPYSGANKSGTQGATFTLNLTVQATSGGGQTGMYLSLINASSDQVVLAPIVNNSQINVNGINTFNIAAQNFPAETQSVIFNITQGTNAGYNKSENVAPYALFGDVSGNYSESPVVAGNSYTINAKAYSQTFGGGTLLEDITVSFSFVNNQAKVQQAGTAITQVQSVYPNTIGDLESLHIVLNNTQESKIQYEVYDQYGRSILRKEKVLQNDTQDVVLDIDISKLGAGLYILSLKGDLMESKVLRFIKR